MTDKTLQAEKWVKRCHELKRVMLDPMWFGKEIMGYDRLTESYHEPMMLDMWERDMRRPLFRAALKEQEESKVLLPIFHSECMKRGREYLKEELEEHPRDHFKTTMMIIRCAKMILLWPEITIAHWHCVEEKAIECSMELGAHFFENEKLRQLRPEIMPSKQAKRFSTTKGFTVKRRKEIGGVYQKRERHPTFFPKGAGSEVTGGHAVVGWLDDIIGQSTIDNSQMPVIRTWLGHTVSHVIRTDGGWRWATGTPWDEDDVYVDMEKDPNYEHRVRACCEDESGKREYDLDVGTCVLYDKKWIKKKMNDPLCNFPYQMMCDRVPDSERRWPADWNGHCGYEWAMQGMGTVFVLSDPAPMGLSLRGEKDKVRGDTGKDWWPIAVVRLRVRGDMLDIILMDGIASQEFSDNQGYDEACRLMLKWRTNKFFDEDYSGGQLFQPFYNAAKRAGVQPYYERDSKHRLRLPQYSESYVKSAKKQRFQKLCDHAAIHGVWVADSCPKEFWEGDGHFTGALTQASKWIPRKGGESNLKWDDHFDVWARATDSKLQQFSPKPGQGREESFVPQSPYRRPSSSSRGPTLTRYV